MLGTPPVPYPLLGFVRRLQDWPVASQQRARRNAMIAATSCAQRRAERQDVADFLAARTTPPETTLTSPDHAVHA